MKFFVKMRWLLVLAVLQLMTVRPVLAQAPWSEQLDVAYGLDAEQKLDVYRVPGAAAKQPAIVFVHGGGWAGGNKREFAMPAKMLAAQGYVTFSLGYRLATPEKNKYPAQVDDVQRALRWIRANADKYGVDAARIGAAGASAGGHLVAFLGTRETRDNSDAALANFSSRVQCVVDIFGPTDFTLKEEPSPQAVLILANFFGKTPVEAPEVYKDASPAQFVDKKSAPALIFHGSDDSLVPWTQSQIFHDALKKAGVESTFIKFDGEGHGFQKPENNLRMLQLSSEFFEKFLKKPAN